jgi:hypothetical protein
VVAVLAGLETVASLVGGAASLGRLLHPPVAGDGATGGSGGGLAAPGKEQGKDRDGEERVDWHG